MFFAFRTREADRPDNNSFIKFSNHKLGKITRLYCYFMVSIFKSALQFNVNLLDTHYGFAEVIGSYDSWLWLNGYVHSRILLDISYRYVTVMV